MLGSFSYQQLFQTSKMSQAGLGEIVGLATPVKYFR